MATVDGDPRRIEPVRRRIAAAKVALSLGAAVAFGGAVVLSWLHNSGHSKQPLRPLAPTRGYVKTVHARVATPGIIDPPIGSPAAATHVS